MPIFKKAIKIFLSLFLPKSEIKQINTMYTQITISLKPSEKKNIKKNGQTFFLEIFLEYAKSSLIQTNIIFFFNCSML